MATLTTPLGEFKGRKEKGCIQYLGIKYANLKDQMAPPEMIAEYGSGIIDATQFGPRAPGLDYCQWEQSTLVQQTINTPAAPPPSGTDCLNLNVIVPDLDFERPLPVMVHIHGGGYFMGGNWWPQKDPTRLVALSVELGLPVIVVSMNYRLGILGNLTSEELRKAGYPGNNTLRDQRCALKWVRAHIHHFGGNPDYLTVFGESAGGASVISHLYSQEPLFKKAISMSGTPILLKPSDAPMKEATYNTVMKDLGLENASAEDRLNRLRSISSDELAAKSPHFSAMRPFVDNDVVPASATFKGVSESPLPACDRKWCSELMIGDTQHDGSVFALMGLDARQEGLAVAFSASLEEHLSSPSAAKATLEAYGIASTTPDEEAMDAIINFATDIGYAIPAFVYAQSFKGSVYRYHFNEPNPWDGPFKGSSTHSLDIFYLFQNYNEKLSPEARHVAAALAKYFINFATGRASSLSYEKSSGLVDTFGPSGICTQSIEENHGFGRGRREHLLKLSRQGVVDLDELSVAWDKFIAGQ